MPFNVELLSKCSFLSPDQKKSFRQLLSLQHSHLFGRRVYFVLQLLENRLLETILRTRKEMRERKQEKVIKRSRKYKIVSLVWSCMSWKIDTLHRLLPQDQEMQVSRRVILTRSKSGNLLQNLTKQKLECLLKSMISSNSSGCCW